MHHQSYASLSIAIVGALSFLGSALEHIVPHVFDPHRFDLLLGSLIFVVCGSALMMAIFGTRDYMSQRHRSRSTRAGGGGKLIPAGCPSR